MTDSAEYLQPDNDPALEHFAFVSRLGVMFVVAVICITVIIAWQSKTLGSILPAGWSYMHPNTALGFFLAVVCLHASRHHYDGLTNTMSAVGIVFIAVSSMAYHLIDQHLIFNTFLQNNPNPPAPHSPSLQTSVFLVALGSGLIAMEWRAQSRWLTNVLLLILLSLCTIFLAGFIFEANHLIDQGSHIRVSVPTMTCMLLITYCLIAHPLNKGFYTLLVRRDMAGHIARSILPLTYVIPLVCIISGATLASKGIFDIPLAAALTLSIVSISMFITVYLLIFRIRSLESQLHEQAIIDELTQVYNLKGFRLMAGRMMDQAKRHGLPLCMIYFDLNHLKKVNDEHGHDTGSAMIRRFADLLSDSFRKTDLVGRVGGDEFVVLCMAKVPSSSLSRLEMLMTTLNSADIVPYRISYSYGCAYSTVNSRMSLDDMMQKADMFMYQQKHADRNQQAELSSVWPLPSQEG